MKKVARTFILFALAIMFSVTAFAALGIYLGKDENDDGNYVYELDKQGNAILTQYNGRKKEEITLPQVIGGYYRVTAVSHAFLRYNYKLKVVNIPDSITAINDKAFSNAYGLETVNIGAGVKSIGESPFLYASKVENVNVSEDNQWFTDVDGVLFSKDMKTAAE